jgi:hypothetical protein
MDRLAGRNRDCFFPRCEAAPAGMRAVAVIDEKREARSIGQHIKR